MDASSAYGAATAATLVARTVRQLATMGNGNAGKGSTHMVTVGLLVRLEAKPGKEADVESFLRGGLAMVQQESETATWYAIRLGPSTYAIFDTFPDDSGRKAHLAGQVAAALMARAPELFAQPPAIEPVDILAAKIPQ